MFELLCEQALVLGYDKVATALIQAARAKQIDLASKRMVMPPLDDLHEDVSTDLFLPGKDFHNTCRSVVYGHELGHFATHTDAGVLEKLNFHLKNFRSAAYQDDPRDFSSHEAYLNSGECLADIYSLWFVIANAIVSPDSRDLRRDLNIAVGRYLYTIWMTGTITGLVAFCRSLLRRNALAISDEASVAMAGARLSVQRAYWSQYRGFPRYLAEKLGFKSDADLDLINSYSIFCDEYINPNLGWAMLYFQGQVLKVLEQADFERTIGDAGQLQSLYYELRKLIVEECGSLSFLHGTFLSTGTPGPQGALRLTRPQFDVSTYWSKAHWYRQPHASVLQVEDD